MLSDFLGASRIFQDLLALTPDIAPAASFHFQRQVRKLGQYWHGIITLFDAMHTCRGSKLTSIDITQCLPGQTYRDMERSERLSHPCSSRVTCRVEYGGHTTSRGSSKGNSGSVRIAVSPAWRVCRLSDLDNHTRSALGIRNRTLVVFLESPQLIKRLLMLRNDHLNHL